jgi:hypothetical protein
MRSFYYQTLPNISLSNDIVAAVKKLPWQRMAKKDIYENLNWHDLEYNTSMGVPEDLRSQYQSFYGLENKLIGTMFNFELPAEIEQEIRSQWTFLTEFDDQPIIRLQIVCGGSMIPVHVDITKTTSLIFPVANHKNCFTQFYEFSEDIKLWQDHYANIKDPSWPLCETPASIVNLPEYCQAELAASHSTVNFFSMTRIQPAHADRFKKGVNATPPPDTFSYVDQVEIYPHPTLLNINKLHGVGYAENSLTEDNPRVSLFAKWPKSLYQHIASCLSS